MFGLVRKSKYDIAENRARVAETSANYWKNRCEEYIEAMNIMVEELEGIKRNEKNEKKKRE